MRELFDFLAYMWLTFSLLIAILLSFGYEGVGEVNEYYFRLGNDIYYAGYLGSVE